jgi:hypothetical protein
MDRREFARRSLTWVWILFWNILIWKPLADILNWCNHEEALKSIDWNNWASLNIVDHKWDFIKIKFISKWVTCNWKLFNIKFLFFDILVWWIRYDNKENKIIIEWLLKWNSMNVPMSLSDACTLIDQIITVSYEWKSWDKIKISWWKWAKLVLQ